MLLVSVAVILPTLRAGIAEYDEYLLQKAEEAKMASLEAFHSDPMNVTDHLNLQVHLYVQIFDLFFYLSFCGLIIFRCFLVKIVCWFVKFWVAELWRGAIARGGAWRNTTGRAWPQTPSTGAGVATQTGPTTVRNLPLVCLVLAEKPEAVWRVRSMSSLIPLTLMS